MGTNQQGRREVHKKVRRKKTAPRALIVHADKECNKTATATAVSATTMHTNHILGPWSPGVSSGATIPLV